MGRTTILWNGVICVCVRARARVCETVIVTVFVFINGHYILLYYLDDSISHLILALTITFDFVIEQLWTFSLYHRLVTWNCPTMRWIKYTEWETMWGVILHNNTRQKPRLTKLRLSLHFRINTLWSIVRQQQYPP